jgi:hypothetical protein
VCTCVCVCVSVCVCVFPLLHSRNLRAGEKKKLFFEKLMAP